MRTEKPNEPKTVMQKKNGEEHVTGEEKIVLRLN